ncbi:MAG: hypothetical protein IK014_00615 [Lachnospiraceae bacterium]|nr:hypothetical protein [Lachnospiraceae bacterium]
MNGTIGIKVIPANTSAKCISVFRSLSSLSIGEIKKLINEEKYILSFRFTDVEGVETIIKCYTMLKSAGITSQLFEHDRPATIDLFKNMSNLYSDIAKQGQTAYEAETANLDENDQ